MNQMKKILIVDDDEDLLVSMKSLFTKNGFDIAVTISCDEGFSILNSFKPDLIFLDLNVGDEDGREMCRKIKEDADFKHIPVVFISSDHEALKLYNEYGAASFLEKPLQFSSLLNIVNNPDNLN
jgi:DNA-binding response OmpR family regulator